MIVFEVIAVLLTLLLISLGVYFLKVKKSKNRTSFIVGYLYVLFGSIGLVVMGFLMI